MRFTGKIVTNLGDRALGALVIMEGSLDDLAPGTEISATVDMQQRECWFAEVIKSNGEQALIPVKVD